MPFLNPYHFVPVTPPRNDEADLRVQDLRQSPHVRHDRYVPGTHSGRIVCRLTTEDPIFVGCEREREATRDEPGAVSNFELDHQPAIPASTLRGLISSIAEAASNSALRVLQDEAYSYRKTMQQHLSAVGMLLWQPVDRKWQLRKLTASHNVPQSVTTRRKVFFGDHNSIQQNGTDAFRYETFDITEPEYYYMRLIPGSYNTKGNLVIAQNSYDLEPIDQSRYDRLPEEAKANYTRGILRVLGVQGRDDIPVYQPNPPRHGKKHELFLPYPEGIEAETPLDVPAWVVDRFHELADECTEERPELPYELYGMSRDAEGKVRLGHGSLVYYGVSDNGVVNEISLSSIWRTAVGNGPTRFTTHDYFRAVDPQLVPSKYFTDYDSAKITIAEQLFGFVEQRPSGAESARQAAALSGRISFTAGLFQSSVTTDPYLSEVTLKILASPKPPCPALYWQQKRDHARRPSDLNPMHAHPKGRKFYWHRRPDRQEPWRHDPPQLGPGEEWSYLQQVRVRPVASHVTFQFEVRFHNLSDRELGLLLYALRPAENFRHKVGMGKPIGLGKVRIDIARVEMINRQERYTAEGLMEKPRATECDANQLASFRSCFTPDPLIHHAITLLGSPNVNRPVHYPIANGQPAYSEKELFRWFVKNNNRQAPGEQGRLLDPLPMPDLTLPQNNQPSAWPTLEPND